MSTASGLFQFLDTSWAAYGGTRYAARAKNATPAQQYEIANRAYAQSGLTPWAASRGCWAGKTATTYAAPAPAMPVVPDVVPVVLPELIPAAPEPAPELATQAASSTIAARAVAAARSRIGDSFVMGGLGPSVFDCSGLMVWSWRAAGVTLPRTAAEQATVGRPVSLSELQAGDILTFYHPVGHVAMVTGRNAAGTVTIVEASTEGVPVHERTMYSDGLVGARRVT